MFTLNDGAHKQLHRCFQSRNGQAAIYVEAVDYTGVFKKEVAGFSYDLHPIPKGSSIFDLINEECRPCTKQEMAHAFCTSDLGKCIIWKLPERKRVFNCYHDKNILMRALIPFERILKDCTRKKKKKKWFWFILMNYFWSSLHSIKNFNHFRHKNLNRFTMTYNFCTSSLH